MNEITPKRFKDMVCRIFCTPVQKYRGCHRCAAFYITPQNVREIRIRDLLEVKKKDGIS